MLSRSRLFLCITALAFLTLMVDNGVSSERNIVSNSGFEMGEPGGSPDEWRSQAEQGAEGRVILTADEARSGNKCLLIEHTNDTGYIHPNKSVVIEPGDYIFRLWAKSDGDIGFLAQIYRETDWSMPFSESCNLENDKWTKFEFPFSALEAIPGSIQIGLTAPGRLWLDDVEIVKMGESKKIADIQIWDTWGATDGPSGPNVKTLEKINIGKPKGGVLLENEYLNVVFGPRRRGEVLVYSKSGENRTILTPLQLSGKAAKITHLEVLQSSDDAASIKACFSADGIDSCAVFSFSRNQIIQIEPAENMKGINISNPIEFAIVPSFISDDLILAPGDYPLETLHIPSENLLLGLLDGGNSMMVITWPEGEQRVRLNAADERRFRSIDFENDGKSLYLAVLDAPGIWHREALQRSYLEKDIAIEWKRPFPAKWITQLYEDGVKTTYTFKESKPGTRGFWRAGVGYYTYPVWFQEDKTYYRLGKKVPPKGESLIYFVERKGTPISMPTPVDILRQTLDDETYANLIDSEGRMLRSLTRPNCAVGTATCGVTDRLKPIFEAGKEVEQKEYVRGGAEDMVYFLTRERERALEYQDFAHEMIEFLASTREYKPELKPFLDDIESIARELIAEFEHEKENIKDLEYARKLAEETQALTQQRSPDNFTAFMKLKGEWIGMGGAVDDLNRKLHTITRKLFQQAGYNCVGQPEAVEVAEEIRKKTIGCLRNPGSYEIWSNY